MLGGDTAYGALGDLEEQFHEIARHDGVLQARRFYWSQVAAALPGCIKNFCYWSVVMFKSYVTIALRNIGRHKTFSIINIAGLAIGMACCIMIMLWVRDERRYDRSFEHAPHLYRIYREFDTPDGVLFSPVCPAALGPAMKNDYPEIEDAARYMVHIWTVSKDEQRFKERIALADPSLLDMFSIRFVRGDRESALGRLGNIVITEELARKYFGGQNPIGKTLRIENWYDASVTGVIESLPEKTTLRRFSAIVNFGIYEPLWQRDLSDWKVGNYLTYIQLRPDADPAGVEGKIAGLIQPYFPDVTAKVRMQQLLKERLHEISGGGLITYVYSFSAIALLVLLIASFNYMNLSTARSSGRATEVGVRRVLGAHRAQLAQQFFGEAVLMSFVAAGMAMIFVHLLLPSFSRLAGKQLSMNYTPAMILALAGIAIAAGMISGIYPALVLSSFKPVDVLKGPPNQSRGSPWFRRVLVVGQFATSIFLIIGSAVIYKQLDYISNKDLGFKTENVINFSLSSEISTQFESFRNRLLADPHVRGVARMNVPPVYQESTAGGDNVRWEGKTAVDHISDFSVMGTEQDFSAIFGIEMVEGRFLSEEFATDMQEGVVLNEAAVRAMGLESPIGKRFSVWDFSGKVIGVVKDFHYTSLHEEIKPLAIIPLWGIDNVCIGISGEEIPATISFISNTIQEFEPGFQLEYRFIDAMIGERYEAEESIQAIMKYGTALAIFISCLGLFGLAAFTSEQRTKEIGIRKILGSSATDIVLLLSKEFSKWVLIANVIAWPIAWLAADRWLSRFAYRTNISPWLFVLAGALALVIAVLTVSYQAFRAARANPADALRYE